MRSKGWKKTRDGDGYMKVFEGLLFEVRRREHCWSLYQAASLVTLCSDLTHADVCAAQHVRRLARARSRADTKSRLRLIQGGK